MPEYENPKIPEGINVSNTHPLKEFFLLVTGVGLTLAGIVFLLSLLAEYLVSGMSFEQEKRLAEVFCQR